MDSKEIKSLMEAYAEVYAPKEEVNEAVKGADPEMRKAAAAERKAGDKPLPAKEGEKFAKFKASQISYIDKKTKGKYIPGMTREEVEEVDEATYSAKAARAGKDIGKPGKMFAKIAKEAGKRYGSEERGKKVAGAVLAKLRAEEVDIFDTVLEYLVSEGYADNNQEALKIMANLSEEEILEYRKLAAAAVGGLMALNMMKPGVAPTGIKRQAPEPDKTELVSKADKTKKDAEDRRQAELYAQGRVDQARRTGLIK